MNGIFKDNLQTQEATLKCLMPFVRQKRENGEMMYNAGGEEFCWTLIDLLDSDVWEDALNQSFLLCYQQEYNLHMLISNGLIEKLMSKLQIMHTMEKVIIR